MSFEAEVIPLFIGGVLFVSILELIVGCLMLRRNKSARLALVGHVVFMLAGFFFLVRCIFANWLNLEYGIPSISNSVNIASFGICWMISVFCILSMVSRLRENHSSN